MASPFERNQQYVRKGDHEYNTPLSREDEKRFLEWVQKNDVRFDSKERAPDYDMRGFWQALTDLKHPDHAKAQTGVNPNDRQIHYSDYWKTPYHQSFSRESQWANKNAPKWNDKDQLVDRSGKVVFDERKQAPVKEKSDMATGFRLGEAIRDQTRSEGMTPRALEILQAAAKAAEAAGLASLDVVAAKGGGHKSHSAGTEWDLVGKNADGSLWTNEQRAQVAQGGRTGGADRFGLYEMGRGLGQGTLHVGYSHGGFQPAVWGAGGQTSGSGSRQFNNAADRTFLRSFESGKPMEKPAPGSGRAATHVADRLPDNWPRGGPTASGFSAGKLDRMADAFFRFGNPQALGAPPQRNVVQEMFDKIGRGRAGVRSDAVPPSPQQRQATLREGMSGPQVKALQQDLIKAGLLDAKGADGKFGPQTAAAVRSLEQKFNLPTQDRGIAGREVFGALRGGQMPPPVPQATPTQRTATTAAPAITPAPAPGAVQRGPALDPPAIPQPSPTPPPTRAIEDALIGLVGAGKIGADSMAPLSGLVGGVLGATAGAPNPPMPTPTPEQLAAHQANTDRLRQSTTTPYPGLTGGMGPSTMGDVRGQPPPLQAPSPGALGAGVFAPPSGALQAGAPNPMQARLAQAQADLARQEALRAQPATPPITPAPLAANPPPAAANPLAAQSLIANPPPPSLAAQAAQALAANTPPPPTAANPPAATINALPDQGGLQIGGRNFPSPQEQLAGGRSANTADVQRTIAGGNIPAALAEQDLMRAAAGRPGPNAAQSDFGGMRGSPELAANKPGPPGGAANYAPRDIGTLARGIESPMFNPPQSTPQFPAAGWGNIPSVQPSSPPPPPPPPPARDQNALLQGLLSMGVDAPNLPGVLANMPGSVSFNPAEAQADAERQKNELYQQMDREDALKQGGGQSSFFRDLGGDAFTGGVSDNLLAGGIPTIQAPSLENIVQPQVGDQGGQGLLGGMSDMFGQAQDVGPAAGKSDSGVLDAISEISIGGNQSDQQPGGDQSATASATSGDNTSAFTPAQLTEQQGILAMLEEMFGEGSTR